MIGAESASLGMTSTGHQEGWTECFQDLQTWCPPAQDELNTPQVTTECFNFGTIDQCQARNLDDLYPADLMPDTLGGDMALLQSPTIGLDDKNNNIDTPPFLKPPQSFVAGNWSYPPNTKSPLKSTSANILLSQSIVNEPTMNKGGKYRPESQLRLQDGIIPFDLEDEENYLLSVPPEQVAKRVQDFRVPNWMEEPIKKERPKLKLDISLPTPTVPVSMPSTPEVQNVLSEPNVGFDLIKYVVSGDYVNLGTVCGVLPTPKYESVERDHDYIDPVVRTVIEPIVIKSEPLSPGSCAATASLIENKIRTTERGRPLKRKSNSDFVFDSEIDESDNSIDWEPSTSKGKPQKIKKARISKSSTNTRAESDVESVGSSCTTDKYRELRDKNNEASRRSRLNRKQRDIEMKKTSDKLESENRALKARAERMQKLVLDMREIIMKTVKGANKR